MDLRSVNNGTIIIEPININNLLPQTTNPHLKRPPKIPPKTQHQCQSSPSSQQEQWAPQSPNASSTPAAVYTNLNGHSPAAHQRALDAGMIIVPLPTLLSRSTWILSIVPPGEALTFAQKIRSALAAPSSSGSNANTTSALPRAFIDCNAVNPEMVKRIGGLFRETPVGFIDAGIVGTPPRDGWDPTFYACSESGSEELLEDFAALAQYGLKVSLLKGAGAGIGDASSLKLCESMMKKGSIGLKNTTAAHRSSPATADALMKELSTSQPALMGRLIHTVPEGIPKAYRFVAEMEGLAEFVGGGEADIFKGFAKVFERVAGSLEGDRKDVETLKTGVEKALELQGTSK